MQPPDDVVEVLGVDGEPAVDVAVEPLGDVVRDARSIGEAGRRVDGDRVDVGAGMLSQLGEGSGRHGPAPADDGHPIGQGLDLAEDVTRQQDRAAILAPLADDVLEGLFHERVEPGGRLVEHEQVGVGGERRDEGDLLPVALGVVADPLGRVEVEPLDEGGPAGLVEAALGRAEDVEALPAGEPRPERDIAGDIGEPFVERRRLAPRVTPEELDVPAAGTDEAEDDPDRGRLARPVGAEEAVDLAGGAPRGRARRGRGPVRRSWSAPGSG